MKVVVISSYDETFRMVGDLFTINHRVYCDTHKLQYELKTSGFSDTKNRHISWDKIDRVIHYLEDSEYDYIFWIDADAFFHNVKKEVLDILNSKPLREVILYRDDKRSMIDVDEPVNPFLYLSSSDVHGPCFGVFLVRKCKEALDFFKRLRTYDDLFPKYPADERAFQEMLANNEVKTSDVAFLRNNVMNSLWPLLRNEDFILHLGATTNQGRIDLFNIFNPYRFIQLNIWMSFQPRIKQFYDSFGSERVKRI